MTLIAEKIVPDDGQWHWFEDYIFLYSKWTVNCTPGRRVQVGMGVFTAGQPRGEKVAVTTHGNIFTVGLGSIHVKVYDGNGEVAVRLDQGKHGLIGITIGEKVPPSKPLPPSPSPTFPKNPILLPPKDATAFTGLSDEQIDQIALFNNGLLLSFLEQINATNIDVTEVERLTAEISDLVQNLGR